MNAQKLDYHLELVNNHQSQHQSNLQDDKSENGICQNIQTCQKFAIEVFEFFWHKVWHLKIGLQLWRRTNNFLGDLADNFFQFFPLDKNLWIRELFMIVWVCAFSAWFLGQKRQTRQVQNLNVFNHYQVREGEKRCRIWLFLQSN